VHVQRLVSVDKMATMHEECNTEERNSVVRFLLPKDSMQKIIIKKCFMFAMGTVCRVKRFMSGSRNVANV
jgi:hypothetical protein